MINDWREFRFYQKIPKVKLKVMKKILVPVDFSQEAMYAVDLACQIARKNRAEITLLHIIEDFQSVSRWDKEASAGKSYDALTDAATNFANYQMDKIEKAEENDGLHFARKIRFGNPFKHVSKSMAEMEADLVVMGSRGVSGLDEVVLGSNTERMMRFAKSPLITVKKQTQLDGLRKIVFASDFSKEIAGVVMTHLKKFLHLLTDVELHLLKVHTPSNWATTRYSTQQLQEFAKAHHLQEFHLQLYNELDEESGIHNFAQDINADIIAMATTGRTGMSRIFTESISEGVVNHSNRTTWTLSTRHL